MRLGPEAWREGKHWVCEQGGLHGIPSPLFFLKRRLFFLSAPDRVIMPLSSPSPLLYKVPIPSPPGPSPFYPKVGRQALSPIPTLLPQRETGIRCAYGTPCVFFSLNIRHIFVIFNIFLHSIRTKLVVPFFLKKISLFVSRVPASRNLPLSSFPPSSSLLCLSQTFPLPNDAPVETKTSQEGKGGRERKREEKGICNSMHFQVK